MTENIEIKVETPVAQPAIGGMMLRKRVKEGKKQVYRMVYVDRPTQSPDPQHNARREAKRIAAQRAKDQKAEIKKEIKKQMDVFDMRFVVAYMNHFAPKGYRFVTVGNDNRIAIQSNEIMGNQKPRGAFISDISFDLIFGLYGDLLNGKVDGPDENLYDRIKYQGYKKANGVTQAQFDKYVNILKSIDTHEIGLIPPISFKSAPKRPFMDKNAVLVQGTMDAGMEPPKYLNKRLHKIVNEIVWWTFRRVMLNIKLSKLQKLRKTYQAHLAAKAVVPGKKFGLATQTKSTVASQKQLELEQRLDKLIHHTLPQAITETNEEFVFLHRQMAQLADMQPGHFTYGHSFENDEGIKPSKKLKHLIQQEAEAWSSGAAQKERVKNIREDIKKTIKAINGEPAQVIQPARAMMPKVFFVNGDKDHVRKIGTHTNVLQQIGWLVFSRLQKAK